MLVNGTLFNSEAWHSVSVKDILLLERVDEALLKGLLQSHSKIPTEALYLETNSVPICFILSSRRLMYLHGILQRDQHELVKKVYDAQKGDTSPGDFCQLVEKDKANIDITMTDSDIASITKNRFKKIIKDKIRKAAFEYLKL